jgi:hypothetical protein
MQTFGNVNVSSYNLQHRSIDCPTKAGTHIRRLFRNFPSIYPDVSLHFMDDCRYTADRRMDDGGRCTRSLAHRSGPHKEQTRLEEKRDLH